MNAIANISRVEREEGTGRVWLTFSCITDTGIYTETQAVLDLLGSASASRAGFKETIRQALISAGAPSIPDEDIAVLGGKNDVQEEGRASLSASAPEITCWFVPREHIRLVARLVLDPASSGMLMLRFMGQTLPDYSTAYRVDGGAEESAINASGILLRPPGAGAEAWIVADIWNPRDRVKLVRGQLTQPGTPPSRVEFTGQWAFPVQMADHLSVVEVGGSLFRTDTTLIVQGGD